MAGVYPSPTLVRRTCFINSWVITRRGLHLPRPSSPQPSIVAPAEGPLGVHKSPDSAGRSHAGSTKLPDHQYPFASSSCSKQTRPLSKDLSCHETSSASRVPTPIDSAALCLKCVEACSSNAWEAEEFCCSCYLLEDVPMGVLGHFSLQTGDPRHICDKGGGLVSFSKSRRRLPLAYWLHRAFGGLVGDRTQPMNPSSLRWEFQKPGLFH